VRTDSRKGGRVGGFSGHQRCGPGREDLVSDAVVDRLGFSKGL